VDLRSREFMPFGVDGLVWEDLPDATIDEPTAVGPSGGTITYGELAHHLGDRVPDDQLDPHYGARPNLLEEANTAVARAEQVGR
jgi:hypothetical protein